MGQRPFVFAIVLAGTLAGCATLPPVTQSYYHPRALTKLVITQALACSADHKKIISVVNIAQQTAYDADLTAPAAHIDFSNYGGSLKDADLALSLTQDGRLAGINAATSGNATAILKSATAIGVSMAAPGAIGGDLFAFHMALPGFGQKTKEEQACDLIADFAGIATPAGGVGAGGAPKPDAKAVTITYTVFLRYWSDASTVYADPDTTTDYPQLHFDGNGKPQNPGATLTVLHDYTSDAIYVPLQKIFPSLFKFDVKVDHTSGPLPAPVWVTGKMRSVHGVPIPPHGFAAIELNGVRDAVLIVDGPKSPRGPEREIWRASVPIPVQDLSYTVLVPRGRAFGKQKFALELSDFGSVTKLEYGNNSGAPEVFDLGSAVAKALPSDASRAAAVQSEADLKGQLERLALCEADATKCTTK